MEKIYLSEQACIEAHIEQYYADKLRPQLDIELLWNQIIDYADISQERGGEGNSGEFHDESEAKKIEQEFKLVEIKLITRFAKVTGWVPIYIKEEKQIWIGKGGVKSHGSWINGYWIMTKSPALID